MATNEAVYGYINVRTDDGRWVTQPYDPATDRDRLPQGDKPFSSRARARQCVKVMELYEEARQ